MHEYGAYKWEDAIAMPVCRVFALHSVSAVRHGMTAAAPSYGERSRIDGMSTSGSNISDRLVIKKGPKDGKRTKGRSKPG